MSHSDALKIPRLDRLTLSIFAIVMFVISFQIHWTETISRTEIRISCSDFFLIFMFSVYVFKLKILNFKNFLHYLRWPWWFLIFTVWMFVSLYVGYCETNSLSTWAIVNKFMGWMLLTSYFFLGNMIISIEPNNIKVILRSLFVSSAVIAAFNIVFYLLYTPPLFMSIGVNDNGRFVGFMNNPNAYGLFSAFVVLLQIPYAVDKKLFPQVTNYLLILLNLSAVLLSGSRTAIIAFIVGVVSFVMHNAFNKKKLFIALFIIIISASFIDWKKINHYLYTRVTEFYILDHAIEERFESATLALNWWLEKPLTGIGLGTFLVKQEKLDIVPIVAIHNTPLWLLTETGIVGLLLYGGFIFRTRSEVLNQTKVQISQQCSQQMSQQLSQKFSQGMLIIFPAFIVASLTTEIFYQRYIWFFLGLVLAKLNKKSY